MRYKDYDISHLPREAFPDTGRSNQGRHSYTLGFSTGAVLEVLLAKEAFYVKKLAPGAPGPTGQVSFSKVGSATEAWEVAKARAGA